MHKSATGQILKQKNLEFKRALSGRKFFYCLLTKNFRPDNYERICERFILNFRKFAKRLVVGAIILIGIRRFQLIFIPHTYAYNFRRGGYLGAHAVLAVDIAFAVIREGVEEVVLPHKIEGQVLRHHVRESRG